MNNNDILGTQNWKQSQADPFLAHKVAIFGKYLYVDNVDDIFHPHPHLHIPHKRIICMNRIFRIRMANPNQNTYFDVAVLDEQLFFSYLSITSMTFGRA